MKRPIHTHTFVFTEYSSYPLLLILQTYFSCVLFNFGLTRILFYFLQEVPSPPTQSRNNISHHSVGGNQTTSNSPMKEEPVSSNLNPYSGNKPIISKSNNRSPPSQNFGALVHIFKVRRFWNLPVFSATLSHLLGIFFCLFRSGITSQTRIDYNYDIYWATIG
jgi:hypothetical protein